MDVGVGTRVTVIHRIDDRLGTLRGGSVVEVDQLFLAMDLLVEDRKVLPQHSGIKFFAHVESLTPSICLTMAQFWGIASWYWA